MNKKIFRSISVFFLFSSALAVYFYLYPPFFSTGQATSYLTFYPAGFPTNYFLILDILLAVLLTNGLEKRKSLFQIAGILTLLYCGYLIVAQLNGAWFAVLGIPIAIGSYFIWLFISECARFLNVGLSKVPASVSVISSIIFALITVYCSGYVFTDFYHASETALNFKYLNMKLSDIGSSIEDYPTKKQRLYALNLCTGFHNQIYKKSCEEKQLESIRETEFVIASRSNETPANYCENYIATIDGASIQKNSDRYWSGLNLCYKSTARNVADCNRIENNQDLRQTCINQMK